MTRQVDVLIIGAGVSGCAVARELAKQKRSIAVVDMCSDVCEGTSKANSAIVHAGYDAKPGTLKAKLNREGNEKMGKLSEELDFPFRRNGSFVLCFAEEKRKDLEALYERGIANGIPDMRILTGEEARAMEPNLSPNVIAALYAPTAGIVCPFNLTIALAENAAENGVDFYLNTKVEAIEKQESGYLVKTSGDVFAAKLVVNAAGVYSDVFHNMVSEKKLEIIPRRGEYCLMDKRVGNLVAHTLFQQPGPLGKGILVTPTVHGNLLVGPTAAAQEDRDMTATTAEGLAEVLEKGALSVNGMPGRQVITSFAGLRAHEVGDDFVIGEPEDAKGFIDVAGIESPGLSCAPALGEYVAELIQELYPVELREDFNPIRKGIPNMAEASPEEKDALIRENPAFANVICRCEMVTEGEILAAIHRPLGATTLDGIKRRTRAGMGRCQSGFCNPKTVEILSRELGIDIAEVTKCGGDSKVVVGFNKRV